MNVAGDIIEELRDKLRDAERRQHQAERTLARTLEEKRIQFRDLLEIRELSDLATETAPGTRRPGAVHAFMVLLSKFYEQQREVARLGGELVRAKEEGRGRRRAAAHKTVRARKRR